MSGSRLGWMLLALSVLAVPLLPHAGALGPSVALATALLAMTALLRRADVLGLAPAARVGLRRLGRTAGAHHLRTPIRSSDPDGRGAARPRAPGRAPVTRA